MAWCVAVGCKSRSGILGDNNELIYFHYFPKDVELRAQWIRNVRRSVSWQPTKYSRLCSLHFEKSCFRNGVIDNSLLGHAVPTIFPTLPPHIEENIKSQKQKQSSKEPSNLEKNKLLQKALSSPCRTEFKKYEKFLMMVPYYERCRCCLRKKNLQDMWREQRHDGRREVYGEMLSECFAINLQQPAEHIERICVPCVSRLRAALAFRNKVLRTDSLINQQQDNVNIDFSSRQNYDDYMNEKEYHIHEAINLDDIENEMQRIHASTEEEQQEDYNEEKAETEECDDSTVETDNSKGNIEIEIDCNRDSSCNEESASSDKGIKREEAENSEEMTSPRSQDDDGAEYLELDFLEDEEGAVVVNEAVHTRSTEAPIRMKTRRQVAVKSSHARDNLSSGVGAVKRSTVARAEVRSSSFKLTADAKRRRKYDELTVEQKEAKQQNREARNKLNEEIKTILTYTNATPYKTKPGKYYCVYCTIDGAGFEVPKTLREHTKTEHSEDRIEAVDAFMRRPTLNEVLKLDIEELMCVICVVKITTWNDMFNHLQEKHDIELDEAYTKIIPYKLDNLSCVLCNEKCPNFPVLNNHMNVHYNSYKCNECAETFLNEKRLRAHEENHAKGTFQCEYCPKVFLQDRYRRKHVDFVHNKKAKYKCKLCPETFHREYPRYLHMVKKHRVKVETYTCELCGKRFNWRPYYLTHMRLKHRKKEKKHQCTLCGKKFNMAFELRNHENWHKGTSDCVCSVCGRKFVSKQYLKKHYETSHKARL